MPTGLDLVYVALFAIAGPLWDYLVTWPALNREPQADPARARRRLWTGAIVQPWLVVAIGAALWRHHGRPWTALGLATPGGWRWWSALGLVLLVVAHSALSATSVARDPKVRESVRQQMFGKTTELMPHSRAELVGFGAVSLTAGFCEEFLFRGYFIWALAPWLGWWGAAALSLLIFASAHAYQGWNGVLRTGIVGALYTLVVAVLGALWPAMALHFLLDFGMGVIAWLALREVRTSGDLERAEASPVEADSEAAPDRRRE